jgi:hypothetical protein
MEKLCQDPVLHLGVKGLDDDDDDDDYDYDDDDDDEGVNARNFLKYDIWFVVNASRIGSPKLLFHNNYVLQICNNESNNFKQETLTLPPKNRTPF